MPLRLNVKGMGALRMSRWLWIFSEKSGRLWVRASLYGVVAVVTALAAIYLQRFISTGFSRAIGAEAVDGILNILAASMLSVTIFSLSTMVAAYSAATDNVTPRATKLLIQDSISQNALSAFIGAFIFSLVGLIALKTGMYNDSGRLVMFVVTLGVIFITIVTLFSWMEYLIRLGRVGETIERVESVATAAFEKYLQSPCMGGVPLTDKSLIPADAVAVPAGSVSYVQHIDVPHLSHLAEKYGVKIYVTALPGKFVDERAPIARVAGTVDEELIGHIRRGFILEEERAFRDDPRFGMVVLAEIGSRGLVQTDGDAGTPIFVIGIVVRILSLWARRYEFSGDALVVKYPSVYVPPISIDDIFDDIFPPIARDGAQTVEVQIRLQKGFAALANTGDEDLVRLSRHHSHMAILRAEKAMVFPQDIERLKAETKALGLC